jgi:transposase-like protein
MQTPNLADRTVAGRVERRGVPSVSKMADVFRTPADAFTYLLANDAIGIPVCVCTVPMARRLTGSGYVYRCRRCVVSRSILHNTLFGMTRLPINQALMLMWAFAMGLGFQATLQLTGVCRQTTCRWLLHLRQMVTQMVVQTDCRIGGEGVVVQIDESKFGKRKVAGNRRGHRVEGAWVFGGVEKAGNAFGNNKFFCTVVENRTAETLLPLIHK